jgi:hypothetical protein
MKVQKPTDQDFKKLSKIIGYLSSNDNNCLTFRSSSNSKLELYVDASFNIHEETEGHTGMAIRFFGNMIYFKSIKQRLVVKSSTEAELVALDEAATFAAWMKEFLSELPLPSEIKPIIIYQDNKSTITMANAGKGNFKRSKHIANRYFWIRQFIVSGEIKIVYVPTDEMLADFLTKPITGQRFYHLRDKLFDSNR